MENTSDNRHPISPGHLFAQACKKEGTDASMEFDFTLTNVKSTRKKPRWTVRNLFKVVDLSQGHFNFWHESPPLSGAETNVNEVDIRPEAARGFHAEPPPELYATSAWVQIPTSLIDDSEALASFINHRLIIRLCTAENQALSRGKGGLINIEEIKKLPYKTDFVTQIYAACNEVEQMSGTADGIVINPIDYWKFINNSHIINRLEENGLTIVRTRMVEPGQAVVGDFGHGAMLFDSGKSTIKFADPPPNTFAQPGLALKAEIHERIGINLPTNFYLVQLEH